MRNDRNRSTRNLNVSNGLMKALFYNHTAHVSGAERVLLLALAGLERDRIHPTVVSPRGQLTRELDDLGIPCIEMGELNARFHLALYRHALQPRTLSIVTALLQSSERFTRLQMNREPALGRAQREHRRLLKLCRRGDMDQACAHLVAHIETVRKDLHRLLKSTQRKSKP